MTLPLIIREEAEADLADAKKWYEQQRAGLSDEFIPCVDAAFERIRRMPEVHPILDKGVRRGLVRRFPYGIFYRVEEDYISVLAVMHNRRDPGAGKPAPDKEAGHLPYLPYSTHIGDPHAIA